MCTTSRIINLTKGRTVRLQQISCLATDQDLTYCVVSAGERTKILYFVRPVRDIDIDIEAFLDPLQRFKMQ